MQREHDRAGEAKHLSEEYQPILADLHMKLWNLKSGLHHSSTMNQCPRNQIEAVMEEAYELEASLDTLAANLGIGAYDPPHEGESCE